MSSKESRCNITTDGPNCYIYAFELSVLKRHATAKSDKHIKNSKTLAEEHPEEKVTLN